MPAEPLHFIALAASVDYVAVMTEPLWFSFSFSFFVYEKGLDDLPLLMFHVVLFFFFFTP